MTKVALPNCESSRLGSGRLPFTERWRLWRSMVAPGLGPDVDWSTFDGILIRTTWDYQERAGIRRMGATSVDESVLQPN